MSDIKLFSVTDTDAVELTGKAAALERDLQRMVERHMEVLLGVRFLASEYSTGNTHKGRIDSLGLDENGCPVIIEYKRHSNENVINQGLFYLDWLLDHRAEFQLLVMEKLDQETSRNIEWPGTRLICIAIDFNKYDEHAVQQINRNIELVRYRYFGDELLLLELVNAQTTSLVPATTLEVIDEVGDVVAVGQVANRTDLHTDRKEQASEDLLELYNQICDYAVGLGDEVQRKELKFYTAFKRIKNFLTAQVWAPQRDPQIRLYLKLNPNDVVLDEGFSADVTNKGHWGTGDLELIVRSISDFEKAKPIIEKSYLES